MPVPGRLFTIIQVNGTMETVSGMQVTDWGTIDYTEALGRQRTALAEVQQGGPARIFVCEHFPVITLGRSVGEAASGGLRVSEALLAERGVALVRTTRGGQATCHYPGQVVVYPIVRIPRTLGVRGYVHALEAAMAATCAAWGVQASPDPERPGLWTANGKIGAVGVAVSRGVAWHGLALNVGADLSLFDLLDPCGHAGVRAVSLATETTTTTTTTTINPDISHVKERLVSEVLARIAQ